LNTGASLILNAANWTYFIPHIWFGDFSRSCHVYRIVKLLGFSKSRFCIIKSPFGHYPIYSLEAGFKT
jgi:hypothetical protein